MEVYELMKVCMIKYMTSKERRTKVVQKKG